MVIGLYWKTPVDFVERFGCIESVILCDSVCGEDEMTEWLRGCARWKEIYFRNYINFDGWDKFNK